MSETATLPETETAPETVTGTLLLRVYGGRLDGAEQALAIGSPVRIGHDFDHQLILRGRKTAGLSVTLHVEQDKVRVKVAGQPLVLLGCPVETGQWALLPFYVPLTLGDYAIAVGEAGSARWAEVTALTGPVAVAAPEMRPDLPDAVPARAGMTRWLGREAGAVGRRIDLPRRPAWLIGAGVALALLVGLPMMVREVRATIAGPAAVEAQLADAGFGGLRVREDGATRALVVEGRVRDERAVEQVRGLLGERFGPMTLNLSTTSGAAEALNGLFQAQGLDAEAVAGPQGIEVHSEYLPADRLAELRQRIAADLPDSGTVRFVRDRNRGPRDLQYFFASDRFGLASLVDGDPGHIVTADGQYWFAGARLPTGHRLVSIANGAVTFERDGQVETLQVAPGGAPRSSDDAAEVPAPAPDLASQPTTTTAAYRTSAG